MCDFKKNNNERPNVTYYTLTWEDLYDYSRELAKCILEEFGVEFDEAKAHFTPDTKGEYMPVVYWLEKYKLDRSTLWRWENEGKIKAHRIGRKVYFCQRDFDEMFAKQKEKENKKTEA